MGNKIPYQDEKGNISYLDPKVMASPDGAVVIKRHKLKPVGSGGVPVPELGPKRKRKYTKKVKVETAKTSADAN